MHDDHATTICPPHHWLICSADGREHWSCQKCGLVRQHERHVVEARRLANVSTWSRDEIALAEPAEPWDEE